MRCFSFYRETIDTDRNRCVAAGDVDGFLASEVAARVFGAAPEVLVAICEVRHYPDMTPHRLVSVMPSAMLKADTAAVRAAVREINALVAVELLPVHVAAM